MTAPSFVVPVADLDRGPKRVSWAITAGWLRAALMDTDAEPRGPDGLLSVELTKTAGEVMVRGRASAELTMPCVRTLDPVDVDVSTEVFLLLDPAPAEPHLRARKRGRRDERAAAAPKPDPAATAPKPKKGTASRPERGRAARSEGEEAPLTESDAARDRYSGDEVVLDPFIREFIVLELPMRPLRSDLRLDEEPASTPPSAEPEGSRSDLVSAEAPRAIDPRLAPLAALKSRLGLKKE